jgi:hypothetical protein
MKFGEGIIVEGTVANVPEALVVSGAVAINLEGDGQALKLIGTTFHETRLVFEQPAGNDRVSIEIDSGDNLDIKNFSPFDDMNLMIAGGDGVPTTALVITSNRQVGVGQFGWEGKSGGGGQVPYGTGENFPGRELDVSGSMRVSHYAEFGGDAAGTDNNFFVTGSVGSKDTATKGTAVFAGDVVVSGSFYGNYRQITYNKFNRGDSNEFFPRFNSNGSNTSAGENNIFLAPADGKLKYAMLRTRLAAGNTTVSLHKANTGTTIANSGFDSVLETISVSSLAAETSYQFIFTDAASFNAGDVVGISINPSNNPDNGNITCVWELDFRD